MYEVIFMVLIPPLPLTAGGLGQAVSFGQAVQFQEDEETPITEKWLLSPEGQISCVKKEGFQFIQTEGRRFQVRFLLGSRQSAFLNCGFVCFLFFCFWGGDARHSDVRIWKCESSVQKGLLVWVVWNPPGEGLCCNPTLRKAAQKTTPLMKIPQGQKQFNRLPFP